MRFSFYSLSLFSFCFSNNAATATQAQKLTTGRNKMEMFLLPKTLILNYDLKKKKKGPEAGQTNGNVFV